MPQPTLSDVHVQAALTNVAVAYFQSEDNYVADKIFPLVPVQFQANKYFVWTKSDFFRDEAKLRADATESAGSDIRLTTQSYAAEVWALHQDIGPQVRSNADPAVDIDATVSRVLMQKLLIRRDRFFVSKYVSTSIWGTDVTGTAFASGGSPGGSTPVYWDDDANGDPFTDVAVGQTTILQNTGLLPNRLLISWNVYQALRKHPLVIDRIKYSMPAYSGTITPQLLAEAFDVEQIVVSRAVYNTAAENLSASMSFITGKHALLVYAADAPSLMTATAGYTFAWQGFTGLNSLGVRIAQIPLNWLGLGTVRTEGEMAFDMGVVGTDLGYFFSGITQN